MTRDPESIRFELDYLGMLLRDGDRTRKALHTAADRLADTAVPTSSLAAMLATEGPIALQVNALATIAEATREAMAALLDAAQACETTANLIGGRILAVAEEAGIPLEAE